MKVTLNLYNPNFKAIDLNNDEKKQVNTTLNQLKNAELSDFQRNILKSDVMDIFIPHIRKEAAESDNPKAKSVDLNMKMFDAINSFADKKDPLGWILSVLNGTKYEEPKPTIFDLSEEETEQILAKIAEQNFRIGKPENKSNLVHGSTSNLNKNSSEYFDFSRESFATYSQHELKQRAVDLKKYFGDKYRMQDMMNIVNANKFLVSYSNKHIDKYVNDFAETMNVDKQTILNSIVAHPEIMHRDFNKIADHAEKISQLTGCREQYCRYTLLRNPNFVDINPYIFKKKLDALSFYKQVRNKRDVRPEDAFNAPSVNASFMKTLIFLVSMNDKKNLGINKYKGEELLKHLKSQNVDKVYKFTLPDTEMTDAFMEYVDDYADEHLDRGMFEFEIIDADKYSRIEMPKTFKNFE